jgi:type IV secretory pathway ATPase VirB11/archaellum biosynthesis ATPase
MQNKLTITELIRNQTLSAEMAGLLWSAVSEKISFLTCSIYSNSGKTTLSKAILDIRPEDISIHYVSENMGLTENLLKANRARKRYLVALEFSPADVPGYIWGEDIIKMFELAKNGRYGLQACLHSESAEEAISELTENIGVSDQDASLIKLVLFIEVFGTTPSNVKHKLVQMYEVHFVENGKAMGHLLYEYNNRDDVFEKLDEAHFFASDKDLLQKRSKYLGELANLGKTSQEELQEAIKNFK